MQNTCVFIYDLLLDNKEILYEIFLHITAADLKAACSYDGIYIIPHWTFITPMSLILISSQTGAWAIMLDTDLHC